MEYEFKNKETIEIYTTGMSSKRKVPISVATKLCMVIQSIEASTKISDVKATRWLEYDGKSVSLGEGWRLKIATPRLGFIIHEVISPTTK